MRIFAAMTNPLRIILAVWNFYSNGFRNMTWGRTLWIIILLKLVILFAVLRLFFFQPVFGGLNDEQKSEAVGNSLSH